jgi:hypothetical protein
MRLDASDTFVVLKWPADAGLPRYSFTTVLDATRILLPVEPVMTSSSIEAAAAAVARLNAEHDAASVRSA